MERLAIVGTASLVAAVLASAAPARPEPPFSGTWVADLRTQQGLPTDLYVVKDGIYSCDSCEPRRRYPADGRLRPVPGAAGISESAAIVDRATLSTRIVQPDLGRTTRMRVAGDGKTATYVSVDRRRGISGPLRTEYLAERVAPGPAGSHAVSGAWKGVRYVSVPVQLRTTILTERGETLSYRTGTGYSYTARYGGPFVPIKGPYDGSLSVSVRKDGPNRVVETRRRGGRDVQARTYTVASDGQRMEMATTDLATGTTFRVAARRRGPR
ncbi:MAG TPA: hypothetical protein VF548_17300 [Allosphingosinicella sp.]|jgi:hypothetical protein